jgi:hypothetical protein
VDPHGEKYVTMNPYMGMFNNPLRVVDPTGMDGEEDPQSKADKAKEEIEQRKKKQAELIAFSRQEEAKFNKRNSVSFSYSSTNASFTPSLTGVLMNGAIDGNAVNQMVSTTADAISDASFYIVVGGVIFTVTTGGTGGFVIAGYAAIVGTSAEVISTISKGVNWYFYDGNIEEFKDQGIKTFINSVGGKVLSKTGSKFIAYDEAVMIYRDALSGRFVSNFRGNSLVGVEKTAIGFMTTINIISNEIQYKHNTATGGFMSPVSTSVIIKYNGN